VDISSNTTTVHCSVASWIKCNGFKFITVLEDIIHKFSDQKCSVVHASLFP